MPVRRIAVDRIEHFRTWFAQFFKPHTSIAPSKISVEAGHANNLLLALFADEDQSARRGIPRASTLAHLVPVLRQALAEEKRHDLLRECTLQRVLIEAGYVTRDDVAEFVRVEGLRGWMPKEDCLGLDLTVLTPEARRTVEAMYKFQLFEATLSEATAAPTSAGEPELAS
jgi:hypothetical protein